MMKLIEIEPHFWELYQNQEQLYLSVSVDNSAVTYNWDLHLTEAQQQAYQQQGRESIVELAKQIVAAVFRGDFSFVEKHDTTAEEKAAIFAAFKQWREAQKQD
ncbi:hypothetical protein [Acinetobacter sp. MB5]|uniref:hypothetical protein n=1 Tax=Acinetobacter sp. MB5 TaxID=2069438 RepID=UPI001D0DB50B|nr:hypothetical protein [Acinetobacter sp. MB5]